MLPLPPLRTRTNPLSALLVGCVFGPIGIGIYFRSVIDVLIPFALLVASAIPGGWVGGVIAWPFAGLRGWLRSYNSNKLLDR
jgi:hypothetical protein